MTKEALELALEALEKLWNIIDDIDTYGDMAKADEKLYRALVERRQRTRFEETGISTDGYELNGGAITAIKKALSESEQEPVAGEWIVLSESVGKLKELGWNDDAIHKANTPQRKPLTENEIKNLWYDACQTNLELTSQLIVHLARNIEAAHGIKE